MSKLCFPCLPTWRYNSSWESAGSRSRHEEQDSRADGAQRISDVSKAHKQQDVLRESTVNSALTVAWEFTDPGHEKEEEEVDSQQQRQQHSERAPVPHLLSAAETGAQIKGILGCINRADLRAIISNCPDPIELGEVWICISQTFKRFQRCTLVCDKLGVSLRPLVLARDVPEVFTSLLQGAVERPIADEENKELELMTQLIHFPWSSILAMHNDAAVIFSLLKPPPQESQRLLRLRPFFRFLGPWDTNSEPVMDDNDGECYVQDTTRSSSSLAAPTQYALGLSIRGQLAGAEHRVEDRTHKSLKHLVGPMYRPSYVVVCCMSSNDLELLCTRINDFLIFSLSSMLQNYVSLSVIMNPELTPNGIQSESGKELPHASPAASLHQGVVPAAIPRLTLSDDGEAFWHLPRQPACKPGKPEGLVSRTISRDSEAAYLQEMRPPRDSPLPSPRTECASPNHAQSKPVLEMRTPCEPCVKAIPTLPKAPNFPDTISRRVAPAFPLAL